MKNLLKFFFIFLSISTTNIFSIEVEPQIAGGGSHTLALKSDGTVWAWGDNYYGQLGNGTVTDSSLPVQVEDQTGQSFLTSVVSISAGYSHSLALKSDGTVWAWGSNEDGQLGDGTIITKATPAQTKNLSGVISISAGYYHSLALKSDGTVWAWGDNYYGQLGNGMSYTNSSLPVQVKDQTGQSFLTSVVSISAGYSHSLALKSDGTVWAWGWNYYGQLGNGTTTKSELPVQVKDQTGQSFLIDVISISAAGEGAHSLALKLDGTVWAWGDNGSGQLGNGTATNSSLPTQVKDQTGQDFLIDIVSVSAGLSHSLALKLDGTVWAWGTNYAGELGNGTTTNSSLPTQVKDQTGQDFLIDIVSVSTGYLYSLALKSDGTVWAWGYNGSGQLGNGTTTNSKLPVQVKDLYLINSLTDLNSGFTSATEICKTIRNKKACSLNLSGSILNDGDLSVSNVAVEFYLSNDSSLSIDDVLLSRASLTIASLEAGANYYYEKDNVKTSSSSFKGKYVITVIDPNYTISESNENNNISTVIVQ